MFRKPLGFASRIGVVTALFTALASVSAFAQAPATGLGQSWPNAVDVSASPDYHVYVFASDGIRYIQLNDLNGTVLGAVAIADNVVLTLPMGVDARHVVVRHDFARSAPGDVNGTETVYSDDSTRITVTPVSTRVLRINVMTPSSAPGICTNPANCNGAPMRDGAGG